MGGNDSFGAGPAGEKAWGTSCDKEDPPFGCQFHSGSGGGSGCPVCAPGKWWGHCQKPFPTNTLRRMSQDNNWNQQGE